MAKSQPKKSAALPGGTMTKHAARVFAELAFATAQGMDDAMIADPLHRLYRLDDKARDFWLGGHSKSIPKALKAGRNWTLDRGGVLIIARKLGRQAAQLAYAAAGAAPGLVIVKAANVRKASSNIRKDPACVAFKKRKGGGGAYCDF